MHPDYAPTAILPDCHALAARVQKDGWIKSTVTETGDNLHEAAERMARRLGNPIRGRAGRKIEPLIPTKQVGANAKSLSVMHGLGSFPMHTDGAHLPRPPTFVVLGCASPGTVAVPTTLRRFRRLHAPEQDRELLETA